MTARLNANNAWPTIVVGTLMSGLINYKPPPQNLNCIPLKEYRSHPCRRFKYPSERLNEHGQLWMP